MEDPLLCRNGRYGTLWDELTCSQYIEGYIPDSDRESPFRIENISKFYYVPSMFQSGLCCHGIIWEKIGTFFVYYI